MLLIPFITYTINTGTKVLARLYEFEHSLLLIPKTLLSYFEPTTYKIRGGKTKSQIRITFWQLKLFIDKNVMITCF